MKAVPLAGRLTAFRLHDIPLELRLRAASEVARTTASKIDTDIKPEDVLFARLVDLRERDHDAVSVEQLRKVASAPSDRLYWIPRAAWDRIME